MIGSGQRRGSRALPVLASCDLSSIVPVPSAPIPIPMPWIHPVSVPMPLIMRVNPPRSWIRTSRPPAVMPSPGAAIPIIKTVSPDIAGPGCDAYRPVDKRGRRPNTDPGVIGPPAPAPDKRSCSSQSRRKQHVPEFSHETSLPLDVSNLVEFPGWSRTPVPFIDLRE